MWRSLAGRRPFKKPFILKGTQWRRRPLICNGRSFTKITITISAMTRLVSVRVPARRSRAWGRFLHWRASLLSETRTSCFVPLRLKPVRTKAPEKSKKTERALFQEKSSPKLSNESGGNGVLRSKVLILFDQLRKSKQPISPGGRLVNFINSLFSSSASTTKSDRSPVTGP
ncbi:hypothetical protein CDL15_Pgr022074 [Punica granatum]|uniref:Uncharacterized protein n=1 Tax=Punica granatum TaxID=22663 RepID=A0A218VSR3_PUNGR|nr:hypothetical protein CDL15_Pgr022074 [Punica granatum]